MDTPLDGSWRWRSLPKLSASSLTNISLNILLGSVFWGFVSMALAAEPLVGEPLSPLPSLESLQLDPKKIKLGERLFHDTRFSRDKSTACASCHSLSKGGADGRKNSVGVRQQVGVINAPSVFNSGLNFRQFWDGRSESLEDQADRVIHDTRELDMNWADLLAILSTDAELVAEFKAAYPEHGLHATSIQNALASYQRSLLTPSRFDRYLLGDPKALDADELKGYQLFKDYGCVACHQGVNIGGNMFQKFGVMDDYFAKRGSISSADLGRFNVTQQEADKYVFKVPSLRNVALTAPYFHDGMTDTLEGAVDVMFRHQLGRTASAMDKQLIVKLLNSLSGETVGAKP